MSLTRADLENDMLRKTFHQAHPEAQVPSDAGQEGSLRELVMLEQWFETHAGGLAQGTDSVHTGQCRATGT